MYILRHFPDSLDWKLVDVHRTWDGGDRLHFNKPSTWPWVILRSGNIACILESLVQGDKWNFCFQFILPVTGQSFCSLLKLTFELDLESCFLICNLGCLLYLEVPLSLVDSPFKISLWHNYGQEHVEPTATDLSHWCLLQNSPDRSSPGWMAIWMALPHKVIQGPGFFHLVAPPHHSCCPYLNTGNGVPATSVFKHIQIGWLEIYF